MWRKLLELLGLCNPVMKAPEFLGQNKCETLDSLLVLKILQCKSAPISTIGERKF